MYKPATFIADRPLPLMLIKFIRLVLLIALFSPSLLFAFSAGEDVSGAKDYAGIQRYPDSKIDRYQVEEQVDYLLALGNLKKINRVLLPEYSKRLKGRLTRITYHIPDGHDPEVAFRHFSSATPNATLLFECHGRECGSSSHWANQIFGISQLYGPESDQHYAVKQLNRDGQDLLLVLYSIKRGNKRVYVHVELLEIDQQAAQGLAPNPSTLLTVWRDKGRFVIPGLKFDEEDELLEESMANLAVVVEALQKSVRLRFWVVGHLSASLDVEMLKTRSLKRANSVKQALMNNGIAAERLSPQGVGPLAPLAATKSVDGRIELVIQP